MKLGSIALGVIAALALVVVIGGRVPAVQDALFERALEKGFSRDHADLFDGDGLKIAFCGTGSPLPSMKRAQACTAVFAGDAYFLVDAGTGSWETLAAAGVPANRLAGVFLTHFHSDHIGDLSEANLASWVMGRDAPLNVYGPEGVDRVIAGENITYELDDVYRTAHHGKAIAPPRTARMTAVSFESADPLIVYDEGGLRVTAFPVKHDPVAPAVGYRFDYQGRSVVISGDTAYSDSLVLNAAEADVLIHEAQANHMVAEMREAAAKAGNVNLAAVLDDIPDYHTSPVEAARAANEAGADWLVLTHFTPAPDNAIAKRIFMRGVSDVRPNHIKMAEDGMVVLLPAEGGVRFSHL